MSLYNVWSPAEARARPVSSALSASISTQSGGREKSLTSSRQPFSWLHGLNPVNSLIFRRKSPFIYIFLASLDPLLFLDGGLFNRRNVEPPRCQPPLPTIGSQEYDRTLTFYQENGIDGQSTRAPLAFERFSTGITSSRPLVSWFFIGEPILPSHS